MLLITRSLFGEKRVILVIKLIIINLFPQLSIIGEDTGISCHNALEIPRKDIPFYCCQNLVILALCKKQIHTLLKYRVTAVLRKSFNTLV